MGSIHPLKVFRESQNPPLSQQQLADLVGVERATVTRWESGARKITEKYLPRVVEVTGIAPAELRTDLAELMCTPETQRAAS